jgi:chromosome segregation ATPase
MRLLLQNNNSVLEQVAQRTATLRKAHPKVRAPRSILDVSIDDLSSIISKESSTDFLFDDEIVNSKVYRKAIDVSRMKSKGNLALPPRTPVDSDIETLRGNRLASGSSAVTLAQDLLALIDQQKKEKEATESQNHQLELSVSSLQVDKSNLAQRLIQAQEELRKSGVESKQRSEELSEELATASSQLRNTQAELRDTESRLLNLQSQVRHLETDVRKLSEDLIIRDQTIEELRIDNNEMQKTNKFLTENTKKIEATFEGYQQYFRELEASQKSLSKMDIQYLKFITDLA